MPMAMAMVDDRRSRLNPYAPVFIPKAAFGEVDDFSSEWWDLVKTSPRFRDYWLSEHQEDDFISSAEDYDYDDYYSEEVYLDMDGGDQFVESEEKTESAPKKGREFVNGLKDGIDVKALLKDLSLNTIVSKPSRGRGPKSPLGPAKHYEKKLANKCVTSPKCTATHQIHQPR